jgi:hypothetical protein
MQATTAQPESSVRLLVERAWGRADYIRFRYAIYPKVAFDCGHSFRETSARSCSTASFLQGQ